MLGSTRRTLAAVAVLGLAASACAVSEPPSSAVISTRSADIPRGGAAGPATEAVTTVIAVSIDGLNPDAIRKLGVDGAPTLTRLIDEGASTLNARTEREQTNTLPNHTGMITGRRIAASAGGHGVTWNDERLTPRTVHAAAGHPVASVFGVVDSPERDTALFASKQKFSLFERSWDERIDSFVLRENNARLVRRVRADIADKARAFRFVHLSRPDVTGHAHGFMSPAYLDAVKAVDALLGRIVSKIEHKGDLADHTVLIVTSDHGGRGRSHRNATKRFRLPGPVHRLGLRA